MNMTPEILEQYLDGELPAEQIAAVEAAMRGDAGARMLARVRAQRGLRAAALGSYAPAADEAGELAETMLDRVEEQEFAPLAKVPAWQVYVRRATAVAAVLLVAATCFWMGRTWNGQNTVYVVVVNNADGTPVTQRFSSQEEMEKFIKQTEVPQTVVASGGGGVF